MGARDEAYGGSGGGDEGAATFDTSSDTPVVTSLVVEEDAQVDGDLTVDGLLDAQGDARVDGDMTAGEVFSEHMRNARVTLSAGFTVTTTPTKVPFDTETFDPAGVHSAGRFTPSMAGYYKLTFRLVTTATGGDIKTIDVRKNGTSYAKFKIPTAAILCDDYSTQVQLDGDDYLEIFASIASGTVVIRGDNTDVGCSEASLERVIA